MAKAEVYNADSMQELDDKSHYRKRPRLVWGDEFASPEKPYSTMQLTAFREIYENAVDEALQGHATRIDVTMHKDHSFEVFDNGRGIPVDTNSKTGKSGIMQALGTLRSGRNFDSHDSKKSTGTNGLGASAVSIFSKRMDVTVYKGGKQYTLSFKHGEGGFFDGEGPEAKFTKMKKLDDLRVEKDARSAAARKADKTGTLVRVWFDPDTFPTRYMYNDQDIVDRLKGTAFLVPELTIRVHNELHVEKDELTGKETIQEAEFNFPGGIGEMVEYFQHDAAFSNTVTVSGDCTYLDRGVAVIQADGSMKNEDVDREMTYAVGFKYGTSYESNSRSYVNTIASALGGHHLEAAQRGIAKAFNEKFSSMRGLLPKKDGTPTVDDFAEGLTLIVSVFVNEPPYGGQAKASIKHLGLMRSLEAAIAKDVTRWINDRKNATEVEKIAKKVTDAMKARLKAANQRDVQRAKNELKQASLPETLVDCELSGTDAAELFICEGDSAKGSLKAARDGRVNAILGLRGKIINSHQTSIKDALKSAPIQNIVRSLGAGVGDEFDLDKVRYGRVFFAVDADVDGNSIAVALYALFWHMFRPMVEQGMLYKLEMPLFRIVTNEGGKATKYYARDESERDEIVDDLTKKKIKFRVNRLKGLGEMNADDLEETAINPKTRIVTRITSEDMEATLRSLDIAIGEDVLIRKEWITEFGAEVDEALLME